MTNPSRPGPFVPILHGALILGGCVLLLLLTRMASAPVLALLRRATGDLPLGVAAYWLSAGVVLIGAPLAGWWIDQAGRRSALVVGVSIVAASVTSQTFLMTQAWTPLYALMSFGVVLVGVAAATSMASIGGRVALATTLAFSLSFIHITPGFPPGMRPLLDMGERAFVVLGVGYLIAAALPLAAIGIAQLMGRRHGLGAALDPAAAGDGFDPAVTIDPLVGTALVLVAGWFTQAGAAASDLARPLVSAGASIWPLLAVMTAGLMSYAWAIAADVTGRPSWRAKAGVTVKRLVALMLALFAIGIVLIVVARSTASFSAGLFVTSLGLAGLVPVVVAAELRGVSEARWASSIGVAMAAFVLGQSAGARLNVFIAARAGALGLLVACGVVAAALAYSLWRSAAPSVDDPT